MNAGGMRRRRERRERGGDVYMCQICVESTRFERVTPFVAFTRHSSDPLSGKRRQTRERADSASRVRLFIPDNPCQPHLQAQRDDLSGAHRRKAVYHRDPMVCPIFSHQSATIKRLSTASYSEVHRGAISPAKSSTDYQAGLDFRSIAYP